MELMTSGQVRVKILIDDDDFERLAGRKVSIGSHGYAQIWEPDLKRMLLLHRWVMGCIEKTAYAFLVDHINRDPYDCRKSNLRIVDPTHSNLNRFLAERDLPLGVTVSRNGRYVARIKRYRRTTHCGTYDTPEAASAARQERLVSM